MNIVILGAGRVGETVAESLLSESNDIMLCTNQTLSCHSAGSPRLPEPGGRRCRHGHEFGQRDDQCVVAQALEAEGLNPVLLPIT